MYGYVLVLWVMNIQKKFVLHSVFVCSRKIRLNTGEDMVKYKKITVRHSAEIAALKIAGVRGKKLLDLFPQYSRYSRWR